MVEIAIENRQKNQNSSVVKASDENRLKNKCSITDEEWCVYGERLTNEKNVLIDFLKDVQRKKFLIINFSVGIFPVILGIIVALYSYSAKTGSLTLTGIVALSPMLVLMALGFSNMIAIKYVAAFKAHGIILSRQIVCLRHAIDSHTYFLFNKRYPTGLNNLNDTDNLYWTVFGKHRKLPIGNEGNKKHFENSTESADKFIINFQYFLSAVLILSPSVYLYFQGIVFIESQLTTLVALAILSVNIFYLSAFLLSLAFNIKSRTFFGEKDRGIEESPPKDEDAISLISWFEKRVIKEGVEYPVRDLECWIKIFSLPLIVIIVGLFASDMEYKSIYIALSFLGIFLLKKSFNSIYLDSFDRIHKALESKKYSEIESPNKADQRG